MNLLRWSWATRSCINWKYKCTWPHAKPSSTICFVFLCFSQRESLCKKFKAMTIAIAIFMAITVRKCSIICAHKSTIDVRMIKLYVTRKLKIFLFILLFEQFFKGGLWITLIESPKKCRPHLMTFLPCRLPFGPTLLPSYTVFSQ